MIKNFKLKLQKSEDLHHCWGNTQSRSWSSSWKSINLESKEKIYNSAVFYTCSGVYADLSTTPVPLENSPKSEDNTDIQVSFELTPYISKTKWFPTYVYWNFYLLWPKEYPFQFVLYVYAVIFYKLLVLKVYLKFLLSCLYVYR